MESRAVSTQATRERVIGAMLRLFLDRWYDEITLSEIAIEAGVALQTVLNHFSSKEGLLTALLEDPRLLDEFAGRRFHAEPGNYAGAIDLLVGDYERAGDAMVRLLGLESRVLAIKPMLDMGRVGQRLWIESIFAEAVDGVRGEGRARLIDLLVCATDVYTWQILRRDRGHSRAATAAAILDMVEAITAHSEKEG